MGNLTLLQALEGKDVKDLLSNVGSGGGAAAPAAGGAAAGGAEAAEAPKEEAKAEGSYTTYLGDRFREQDMTTDIRNREGGVRRRHGIRSLRLSDYACIWMTHLVQKRLHSTCMAGELFPDSKVGGRIGVSYMSCNTLYRPSPNSAIT